MAQTKAKQKTITFSPDAKTWDAIAVLEEVFRNEHSGTPGLIITRSTVIKNALVRAAADVTARKKK